MDRNPMAPLVLETAEDVLTSDHVDLFVYRWPADRGTRRFHVAGGRIADRSVKTLPTPSVCNVAMRLQCVRQVAAGVMMAFFEKCRAGG